MAMEPQTNRETDIDMRTHFERAGGEPPARPSGANGPSLWRWALLGLMPGLALLRVKQQMMACGGYMLASRSFGRDETSLETIPLWESLSFYRGDLVVGLILLPLSCILMARLLPRRLR